jgi:sporulation protein YlmC with PRC-barrel domain
MSTPDGRRLPEMDALHQLLDRQILDNEGRMVSKVDDVELEERDDGRLAVTALLTGPGALGPRIGGTPGTLAVRGWSRLSGRPPDDPTRIDYSDVTTINTAIKLGVTRASLAVDGFEVWARTRLIAALPGAGEDPE